MEKTDFTELKQFAINVMDQGVILSSCSTGNILSINPAAQKMFGITEKEAKGGSLCSVLCPDKRTGSYDVMVEDLDARGEWSGEVRRALPNSISKSVYACAKKVTHPELGNLILTQYQEQFSSNTMRAALEESESLRQRAQKLAKIGHWRLDPVTSVLQGTNELYEIFELPKNSALEDFDKTVHPDDREGAARIIQLTIENGGAYDSSYRLITANNNRKWVHAIGEAVLDKNGMLIEITGSVQDITAFRMVEEELQKMQKLKSLGVMAGGIAHDFNNIHTMLFGNISLARSKLNKDHPASKDLDIAGQAITRATNLSNQLLTFAKGGDPVKRRIDIGELIAGIVRFDLTGSNVKACFDIADNLWNIDADQGQIEQVITNLVINAKQAMPTGGLINISMSNYVENSLQHTALQPGKYVKVELSDHGEGIREDHLAQIFDPYFSTKMTGSGLGLATVYSIISRHGGHIDVYSSANTGTTFTFYVSAIETDEGSEMQIQQHQTFEEPGAVKILIMDDEVELCELAKKILEMVGYKVDCAYDGKEALEKYTYAMQNHVAYGCVIMDLTIPGGMGGKELIQDLIKIDPDVDAIVSSGYAVDPVMANYTEYGFKGVIPKPYSPAAMIDAVQLLLGS